MGQERDGISMLARSVNLSPMDALARENYAVGLLQTSRPEAAIGQLLAALVVRCDRASLYVHLGSAWEKLKNRDRARVAYGRVIDLGMMRPDVCNALSVIHDECDNVNDAEKLVCLALISAPSYGKAISNWALLLKKFGRAQISSTWMIRATSADPEAIDLAFNRAALLLEMRVLDDAYAGFQRTLQLSADHAEARFNKATIDLLCGRYPQGWNDYEWRWKTRVYSRHETAHRVDMALFRSGRLRNETVLFIHEQGFGDTIQFCRYGALVSGLGGKV
ncbi:MAG: hypothetical protein EBU00_12035, partial [Alphaproteobacteria bacterium]|nr:hypothetical protein [Alphaproteobacteria bacterium]